MKIIVLSFAGLTLLLAACTTATANPLSLTTTRTSGVATTFLTTATSTQPMPTATLITVEGTVLAQINVRSGPGTDYASLGLAEPGQKVQIVGQDQSGKWYALAYPTGPQGLGWVTATYIQADATVSLPLIVTVEVQSTPSGNTGKTMQQVNVRSGPGTEYQTLGTLPPQSMVALTGKNETASWLQIEYTAGSGGHGWINAAYVQASDTASLPVLDASGTPVTPQAEAGTPAPFVNPTSTVGPAPDDGDSTASPAIRVIFSASGTRQFTYSSDVSTPPGDAEDWVEFSPYTSLPGASARMTASLACTGNGSLVVDLWQNGAPLAGWGELACGERDVSLTLAPGQPYQFRLSAAGGEGLQLVRYVLTVHNDP